MSNRLLCPISLASKMWYWSPVIGKVECIKFEDIKIVLLWCLDFPPVNYYSISKQEGSTLNCTYQNQMNSNCSHQFSKKVNVICECSLMKTFVSLWILMHSCLLTRNIFIVVWPLIFMGKPKSMEELMHNGMVVKAVAVQHHLIFAIFFTDRWFAIIIIFVVFIIFHNEDIVFFIFIPGS